MDNNDTPIFDNMSNGELETGPVDESVKNDHYTENVVIKNPTVRKAINTALSTIGAALAIATAVDIASPAIDLTDWTLPIFAGYSAACAVFGIAVINPNVPKG